MLNRAWHPLRAALLCLSLLCLATGAGCTVYTVQQPPVYDPLRGARNFILEPPSYPALSVGGTPEPAYLSRKDDQQRRSWEADKSETARVFMETALGIGASSGLLVQQPPPPGPGFFILRPVISFIEPGNFNGFFNKSTQVMMTLIVFNPQGQQIDQMQLAAQIPASLMNPSTGGRMRAAGQELGQQAMGTIVHRALGS